jgi:hypothetical protein
MYLIWIINSVLI